MSRALLCLTLFNGRPQVSRIFLEGIKRLGIDVLAHAPTEEDEDLLNEYGHSYLTKPHHTLGGKWNALITTSLYFEWDHILISGDDNLYSPLMLDHIRDDYAGLEKLYFIHPSTKQALLLRQPHNVAIGTGRFFSRKLIESKIVGDSVQVFPEKNRELDHEQDLMLWPVIPTILDKDKEVMCIDIKHAKNIWGFNNFRGRGQMFDYESALSWVGERERKLIRELE